MVSSHFGMINLQGARGYLELPGRISRIYLTPLMSAMKTKPTTTRTIATGKAMK